MYNDYFSFHRTPFSIAPDPDFLYLSGKHREALAHLVYGLQTDGGFVLLTGEVGTGKTTLLRSLLSQIPDNLDVAFILNPKLTVKELLETLCEELGVPVNTHEVLGVKQFIDRLNRQLLKTHALGRSTVLIIDEAQNLSPEVLEQIRLLTNLETNEKKLLRIILIGQPELSEILYRDDLRQLAQRITARYHLSALSSEDTYEYIYHRLKKSGGSPNTFSKRAIRRVHKLSKGIPRLINIIADRALLGAYVESSHQVTAQIVNTAAKEIRSPSPYSVSKSITAAALLGILIALWYIQLPTNHLMPFQPTQHTAKGTLGIEPSAVLNKEPSAVLGKEPSAALNKQPSAVLGKEPSAALNKQPSAVPNKQPPTSTTVQALVADKNTFSNASKTTVEPYVPSALATQSPEIPRPPNFSQYQLHRQAFEILFQQWGISIDETTTIPCNFAPSQGLQCLRRTAEWADVIALNRPFILELNETNKTPFYATVTDQSGMQLTFQSRHRIWQSPTNAAPANWNGYYILLWRMPPSYKGIIHQGSISPSVQFLRQNLATILNRDITHSGDPLHFDRELELALYEFQRSNNITADGIAGALTWLILNTKLITLNNNSTTKVPTLRNIN